ncbi:hypothetical protein EJ05DRAFT_385554 [Pseudovirgaria hyperparasitica]|uniref:SMP-LTD domain-containing protein n=1 Tax=Pseudovirgaria hyperparasitica TaxID=470096 RepID=A0A6A6W5S9_9PEZI|nr:uncharacterized protein EJ05DRAFT_385554 [Pseudovirgaria hyperparasitica]KAF2757300.1 hypothetical protein EJ05DRAFT_385554 [Pseudovirgaria hyperparasitica]
MVSLSGFLFIYVLGGITFIPLVLVVVLLHARYLLPVRDATSDTSHTTTDRPGENSKSSKDDDKSWEIDSGKLPAELKKRTHEPDVAAGYFAVCREYVPGGVNGKPPERTTPAGEVVATESPSVYQSMYRSIFDRNKSQIPTLDSGKTGSKPLKKARNVFFVVLRHGHLMLYDDAEQLEVRHVISLAYYDVDVYAGGETIPEGELFIKRNCVRLVRRRALGTLDTDAKPFYLFCDNCSLKEDFYHAMLANQEKRPDASDSPPSPLQFDTQDIVKLVQTLHASEETLQTRWFNALLGRVFLGIYQTPDILDHVKAKITKKIARVPKPAFITSITVQKIDMGDAAPTITHPKLRDLSVDGQLTCEADVQYKGNFSIEILAVARIDLGKRFQAREVHLTLAGVLKKLEGHLLIRIKPPPSNRIWISFETAPQVEMSIEPIVSQRQITYGVILRAIESRIREVIGETLVYPNWDDVPFHETLLQRFRGGIWRDDHKLRPLPDQQTDAAEHGLVDKVDKLDKGSDSDESDLPAPSQSLREKTMSMPSLVDTAPRITHRKSMSSKSAMSLDGTHTEQGTLTSSESRSSPKPRAMRSTSFASAATPVVNLDPATVEALKRPGKQSVAQSAIKDISMRSPPTSPPESPYGSPPQPSLVEHVVKKDSVSSQESQNEDALEPDSVISSSPKRSMTQASISTTDSSSSHDSGKSKYATINAVSRAGLNQATIAAKKWFANRQQTHNQPNVPTFTAKDAAAILRGDKELEASHAAPAPGTPSNPIGRGQPLPPPGQPLPHPPKQHQTAGGWYLTKRKPAPQSSGMVSHSPLMPATPTRRTSSSASSTIADATSLADPGREKQRDSAPDTPDLVPTAPDLPPRPGSALDPGLSSADQTHDMFSINTAPLNDKSMSSSKSIAANERRKSSTASLAGTSTHAAPPSSPRAPPRRKRLSVAHARDVDTGPDNGLLVVKAPVADDVSPLASPEKGVMGVIDDPLDVEADRVVRKEVESASGGSVDESRTERMGRHRHERSESKDDDADAVFLSAMDM